jgi:hypothetical protein
MIMRAKLSELTKITGSSATVEFVGTAEEGLAKLSAGTKFDLVLVSSELAKRRVHRAPPWSLVLSPSYCVALSWPGGRKFAERRRARDVGQ